MEELYKNKYKTQSTRLFGYNYGLSGYYFITICTKNRICFLGDIKNDKMILSDIGKTLKEEWLKTEEIRTNVMLDEFIIMPNHIHGIIIISNENTDSPVETHCNVSLPQNVAQQTYNNKNKNIAEKNYKNKFGPQKNNLSSIIRGFKSTTTKQINIRCGYGHFAWQPKFYDHIIRNEKTLDKIRQYIKNNPQMWHRDRNNLPGLKI